MAMTSERFIRAWRCRGLRSPRSWPSLRARAIRPCAARDRKSTRLNSSHVENSYAVFCLKKKTDKHFVGIRLDDATYEYDNGGGNYWSGTRLTPFLMALYTAEHHMPGLELLAGALYAVSF